MSTQNTQYDLIGTKYNNMHDLPCVQPEKPTVIAALGDVKGLRCLDLACGTGRYSRLLVDLGAASCTGYDISTVMVQGAKEASKDDPRFHFEIADCSQPLPSADPYDLIFAGWFLNYASNVQELTSMFHVISDNLTPTGRFVGITTNAPRGSELYPMENFYGIDVFVVGNAEGGWKLRLKSDTEPPVEFEMFHLTKDVYEQAAKDAGLRLEWCEWVLPDDERKETGFWKEYLERPDFIVVKALKR